MNGFDNFFSAELGQGQECVLWCATCTHRTQQHCVLTNTDRSHGHRIHGLGIGLIWVPKAVLQINHNKLLNYVFPFFLQEFGSYSAKDYLKFDCSSYDLHRLRFLWKGFAFCLYEGWLMCFFWHSICSFKHIQS